MQERSSIERRSAQNCAVWHVTYLMLRSCFFCRSLPDFESGAIADDDDADADAEQDENDDPQSFAVLRGGGSGGGGGGGNVNTHFRRERGGRGDARECVA